MKICPFCGKPLEIVKDEQSPVDYYFVMHPHIPDVKCPISSSPNCILGGKVYRSVAEAEKALEWNGVRKYLEDAFCSGVTE